MKFLVTALLVCCATAGAAHKKTPPQNSGAASVAECFKVGRLLKTDSTHYWADWRNACPYTIDAVYVMVGFLDHSHNEIGNGVWPMYFVEPGAHRVTRFSSPVADFETVQVHRITTDSATALGVDRIAIEALHKQSLPPGTVGDSGASRVVPENPESSGNKTRF